MEKYFAKYLPNGEKKPFDDTSREWETGNVVMDGNGEHWIVTSDGGMSIQKAKLFLCTNNIHVGDNIYDNVFRLWENCELCFWKVMTEGGYGFKIVGEIKSSEFNWINDGTQVTKERVNDVITERVH